MDPALSRTKYELWVGFGLWPVEELPDRDNTFHSQPPAAQFPAARKIDADSGIIAPYGLTVRVRRFHRRDGQWIDPGNVVFIAVFDPDGSADRIADQGTGPSREAVFVHQRVNPNTRQGVSRPVSTLPVRQSFAGRPHGPTMPESATSSHRPVQVIARVFATTSSRFQRSGEHARRCAAIDAVTVCLAFGVAHAGHFVDIADVSAGNNQIIQVRWETVASDVGAKVKTSEAENQRDCSVIHGLSTIPGSRSRWRTATWTNRISSSIAMTRMGSAPGVEVHFDQGVYPPPGRETFTS